MVQVSPTFCGFPFWSMLHRDGPNGLLTTWAVCLTHLSCAWSSVTVLILVPPRLGCVDCVIDAVLGISAAFKCFLALCYLFVGYAMPAYAVRAFRYLGVWIVGI
jgi:hypothetical protein